MEGLDRNETINMVSGFFDFQNDYYSNKKNDEDLTYVTTQPCWQSMKLVKDRLNNKNLSMSMDITHAGKKSRFIPNNEYGITDSRRDGASFLSRNISKANTKKIFYKNGKPIFTKKDSDIVTTSIISSDVNGDMVACPNCGGVAAASTYIDGCDYCGSRFSVKELEPKISGCTIAEDVSGKLVKSYSKIVKTLIWVTVFVIIGVVALCMYMASDSFNNDVSFVAGDIAFGTVILLLAIPTALGITWKSIIWFVIVALFLKCYRKSNIKNDYIVKRIQPDFSAADFVQTLDYQLKSILFATDYQSVSSFARIDFQNILSRYSNIIDAAITEVEFTNANRIDGKLVISANVKFRLYNYNGSKVKEFYEQFAVTTEIADAVLLKNVTSVRKYPCKSCGSSINLLNGGVCDYCGNRLNFEDYGYVITEFNPIKKFASPTVYLKLALYLIYAAIVLFGVFSIKGMVNEKLGTEYKNFKKAQEYIIDENEKMNVFGDFCPSAKVEKHEDKDIGYELEYSAADEDIVAAIPNYDAYLCDYGFEFIDSRYVKEHYVDEDADGKDDLVYQFVVINYETGRLNEFVYWDDTLEEND